MYLLNYIRELIRRILSKSYKSRENPQPPHLHIKSEIEAEVGSGFPSKS